MLLSLDLCVLMKSNGSIESMQISYNHQTETALRFRETV